MNNQKVGTWSGEPAAAARFHANNTEAAVKAQPTGDFEREIAAQLSHSRDPLSDTPHSQNMQQRLKVEDI